MVEILEIPIQDLGRSNASGKSLWMFLTVLLGFYFIKRLYYNWRFAKLFDKIPGPKPFPFIGNIRETGFCGSATSRKVHPSTASLILRHAICNIFHEERIFRVWFAGKPIVFLYGAETVEPLLTSNVSINKSKFYKIIEPWLGKGLLLREGEQWRLRRKFLTPAFHFRILQDFLPVMNNHSRNLVRKIALQISQPWIDVVPLLTNCTLDIISETAMGFQLNSQDNNNREYAEAVHDATRLISYRNSRPWLWIDSIYNCTKEGIRFNECVEIINGLTYKVIKEKKDVLQPMNNKGAAQQLSSDSLIEPKKKRAFLDLLLEKHFEDLHFTEKDMADEVNTFMFGGHDTTATSLTWILYLLGLHPEIQDKVFNEIFMVFGESDCDVTQDEIRDLKYLDMVIKESQRIYPPVPGFAREAEENLKIGKFIIPEGTSIYVFTYALHRDHHIFPNPEVFDPERFSIENSNGRHPYAFLPFSAGPRNCIGQKFALMEEKVLLSHVLRNYKVISLDPRDKVLASQEVVLRPIGNVRLRFEPREKTQLRNQS